MSEVVIDTIPLESLSSGVLRGNAQEAWSRIAVLAMQQGLNWYETSRLPGWETLGDTERLVVEFLFLSRYQVKPLRHIAASTALIDYSISGSRRVGSIRQPLGRTRFTVIHGYQGRLIMRQYRVNFTPDTGESVCELVSARNLSQFPVVPPLQSIAHREGWQQAEAVRRLQAKHPGENVEQHLNLEAMRYAAPRLSKWNDLGIEHSAFPVFHGAGGVSVYEDDLLKVIVASLRAYRSALESIQINNKIFSLCRTHMCYRHEVEEDQSKLGERAEEFRQMRNMTRSFDRAYRTSGLVLPDYVVQTTAELTEVSPLEDLCDGRRVYVLDDVRKGAPNFLSGSEYLEDWNACASWFHFGRPVELRGFDAGVWSYEEAGEAKTCTPDEFGRDFSWRPKPLLIRKSKYLQAEDLQFYQEGVGVDFASCRFSWGRLGY